MKKFIAAFAVLAVMGLSLPAFAGWNIQQQGNGGAVWTDGDGNSTPVGGGSVINVRIADLSTAATEYVVLRRAGEIVALYGVSMSPSALSSGVDNTITVWLESSATNGNFLAVSGGSITLAAASDAGTNEADTDFERNSDGTSTGTQNAASQGQVIAIHTDGSGTGATPGMITIVIE
jgi:hypothetical protein